MLLRELNEAEGMKLIEDAKRGDKQKKQIIIESFKGLIKSSYVKFIYEGDYIYFDDFEQECNVKIIKCINNFRKKSVGQFCSFIEKSINHCAIDFIEKHRNYSNFNVICENKIEDFRMNKIDEGYHFENQVVSEITAYESFNNLIKDKLSKRENHALYSHITGESIEKYAADNGIKADTARRTLNRAIKRIANKEEIRVFHCLIINFFILVNTIMDETGIFDILEVLR